MQGLQGLAPAQGLHGFFAAQGLQGLHFLAAQGLHLAAAQGLHFLAAQGLHFAAQGLHFLAAQGLQGLHLTPLASATIRSLGAGTASGLVAVLPLLDCSKTPIATAMPAMPTTLASPVVMRSLFRFAIFPPGIIITRNHYKPNIIVMKRLIVLLAPYVSVAALKPQAGEGLV